MLYAFGSNGSAQLGVGHTDDLSKPEAIATPSSTSRWSVKQLAAGGNHTIILCDDGKVRATGNNEDGRCGIRDVQQLLQFTEVPLPLDGSGGSLAVRRVTASWSATAFLCDDGHVYVCGSGSSGELGLGPSVANSPSLARVPDFPPPGTTIMYLASGMAHMIAVLSNGEVYGWGKGRKGQLGEPAQDVWSPRRVSGLDFGAIKASCGKDFTFVVGDSSTGQMAVLGPKGIDRFGIRANAPVALASWVDIAASWCSVYALKASGDIMAWGRDDHGQLPPRGLPKIEAIAAGSEHCLALTRAGEVLAWGWGEHGNCGVPTDDNGDVKARWNEIDAPGRIAKIYAGCATSFVETVEEAYLPR
ncbi:alpha tubulin suppressor [Vermiconidia calcicola]|uniref:Alpha tubulin suppressor n=1 Tax=Vermiconidia calcicola TaxID=1690605 RepID=A0ACC3NXX2_9PEZI|nr:alpha tubulin suppressor [Vermiconidia calcicola]